MRLIHFSDLHLGFRQYQRLTPGGINQREADVARSFEYVVGQVIGLAPDVVMIAGDVFHNVRPTNPAILHAFQQLVRLTRALPDTPVIAIGGNHDTPRSTETGGILRLFQQAGVTVVDQEAKRLSFPELGLSVLAVPDVPGALPALTTDPSARYNVLLLHGAIPGITPEFVSITDRAAIEVSQEELGASRWNYVALGHHHVFTEVAPNAFYSGSIDYTSVNPWGDRWEEEKRAIGKGFVEFDLETGTYRFHRIPPSRPLIELESIWARGLTVGEVDARIQSAVETCPGGIDDKIVRLVVRDLPRHIARDLDHRALREYKRRALHFHLDTRRPEVVRSIGVSGPGRRPSLAELVRDKLQSRMIEADIDRATLVELGLQYLRDAESVAPAATVDVEG